MTYEDDQANGLTKMNINKAFGYYDIGTATRFLVHHTLYIDSIQELGTEKHMPYIRNAYSLNDYGCFCMTELGHGSNVNGLGTVATFDPVTREFVLHSPTATAAKWWVGALGDTANMAVVFAQLLLGD